VSSNNQVNITSNPVKDKKKMTKEDELIIKMIAGSAAVLIVLICIGSIVKSVRHVMSPDEEYDVQPKSNKMSQVIVLTQE
jgi:hypothetical protein